MTKKDKIVTIILLTIIVAATTGIAETVYVTNKADALKELGKSVPKTFTAGECKVTGVSQVIGIEDEGEIMVEYWFSYIEDGEQMDRMDHIEASTTNQAEIETLVAKECDAIWAKLSQQAAGNKVTSAYINYTQGDLSSILNRAYNVVTKQWKTASVQAQ